MSLRNPLASRSVVSWVIAAIRFRASMAIMTSSSRLVSMGLPLRRTPSMYSKLSGESWRWRVGSIFSVSSAGTKPFGLFLLPLGRPGPGFRRGPSVSRGGVVGSDSSSSRFLPRLEPAYIPRRVRVPGIAKTLLPSPLSRKAKCYIGGLKSTKITSTTVKRCLPEWPNRRSQYRPAKGQRHVSRATTPRR